MTDVIPFNAGDPPENAPRALGYYRCEVTGRDRIVILENGKIFLVPMKDIRAGRGSFLLCVPEGCLVHRWLQLRFPSVVACDGIDRGSFTSYLIAVTLRAGKIFDPAGAYILALAARSQSVRCPA